MDTDRRKDEHWEHAFDFFSEEHTIHGTNDTLPTDDTSAPITTTTTTTTATLQKYNITLTKKFDHEPAKSTPATAPPATATPAPATMDGTDTAFGDDGISSGDQDDDGLFETRATLLMEQMASLHGQLGHMLPTRSYYNNNGTSSSSLGGGGGSSNGGGLTGGGGAATTTTTTSSLATLSSSSDPSPPPLMISCTYASPVSLSPGEQWGEVSLDGYSQQSSNNNTAQSNHTTSEGLLHPLQAAHEDITLYESNLMTMRRQMGLIKDGMEWIYHNNSNNSTDNPLHHEQSLVTVEDQQDVSNQRQLARLSQMDQAYHSLQFRMDQAEHQFQAFRQGFNFSQACHGVRVALDTVQANMMQQKTMMTANHHQQVVQAWEESIAHTTQQLANLRLEYPDYFLPPPQPQDGTHDNDEDDQQQQLVVHTRMYEDRWTAMQQKNELVRSWVEEVRVWFAEAERIRQWIDERRDQLEETTLPDPLAPLEEEQQDSGLLGLDKVKEWKDQHQTLETDMEHFDQQDMARLRSHVKTLTGKDLSPADTTTIEITLTTLTTLDKVMHALRTKRDRLHLLTQRALWEAEYAKTMQWLHTTENEVDSFLGTARWPCMDDDGVEKAELIDGLLTLEHKLSEFDKQGFTTTVDLFQDLDDAAQEDLPRHLEQRQTDCEQFFEDLFKRMAYVRSVVEQRLAMMDFMALVDQVAVDAQALQVDMDREAANVSAMVTGDDDEHLDEEGWAERVQAMQERIIPLASAQRIPYPAVTLMVDQEDNEAANQMIRQFVGHHRTQLVLMGEAVDGQWQTLRQKWQLQQRMTAMAGEADQWAGWAQGRSAVIQENHQHLLNNSDAEGDESDPTLDQLAEWERALNTIQAKAITKKTQIKQLGDKADGLLKLAVDGGMTKNGLDRAVGGMIRAYKELDQAMAEHEAALAEGRRRFEQGHSAVDRQKELAHFIQTLRTSLPGLKQTCGFMTGQSQVQDHERLETLTRAVDRISGDVAEKQAMVNLYLGGGDDGDGDHSEMVDAWTALMGEIAQLEVFRDTVQQWYDRQRRLSLVEATLAPLLTSNSDDDDQKQTISVGQDQLALLSSLGQDIGAAADTTDPLQTANYSCAKERHQVLVNRAQVLIDEAHAKQQQRDQASSWQRYQDQVDQWVAAIEADCATLESKLAAQDQQVWDHLVGDVHGLAALTSSNTSSSSFAHHRSNWPQPPSSSPSSLEGDGRIKAALDRLDQVLAKEKRQSTTIRHLHVHAKAAQDLHAWLDNCGAALNQLTLDIGVQDELDVRASLGRFEAKLESMQPALAGFGRLEQKILLGLGDEEARRKDTLLEIGRGLRTGFDQVGNQLKDIALATDQHRHHVGIARKMKDLLHMIGGYRDTLAAIRIPVEVTHGAIHDYTAIATPSEHQQQQDGDNDCLSPWLLTCPLSMLPTDEGLALVREALDRLEHDMQVHLDDGALQELDDALLTNGMAEKEQLFMDQRKEITEAIAGLTRGIQEKRRWLAEASKLEFILTVLEEWEVLMSALAEVVDRATPSSSSTTSASSTTGQEQQANHRRAELQAKLIDLDTRYRYYEPNIQALVKEAQLVMMMHDGKDPRIVAYYDQLTGQWRQLQQLALAKKQALMAKIGPLAEPLEMSGLHDALPRGYHRRFDHAQQQEPRPRPMTTMSTRTTTTTTTTAADRGCARKASYQQLTDQRRRRTVTPTSAGASPRLMTAERAKKRSSWREPGPPETLRTMSPVAYVADPKNDLDVALGNIVNDSPYAIKVKMVPGEVGRYWFGKKNPKLAYCRILRSRMVMVRVGGGWVELSQFLRDHALLEEGRFSSTRAITPTTPTTTTTVVKKRHSHPPSTPGLRHSRSTPFEPASYYCHPTSPHGIKNGNKFLVTDDDGNQVQVTMTKARSKQTSAYRTPWR